MADQCGGSGWQECPLCTLPECQHVDRKVCAGCFKCAARQLADYFDEFKRRSDAHHKLYANVMKACRNENTMEAIFGGLGA